jgi:hypothetical protein
MPRERFEDPPPMPTGVNDVSYVVTILAWLWVSPSALSSSATTLHFLPFTQKSTRQVTLCEWSHKTSVLTAQVHTKPLSLCMHPAVNLALIPEFPLRCWAACERTKVIYVHRCLVHRAIRAGRDGCTLLCSYALLYELYNQTHSDSTDRGHNSSLAPLGSPAAENYTTGMRAK